MIKHGAIGLIRKTYNVRCSIKQWYEFQKKFINKSAKSEGEFFYMSFKIFKKLEIIFQNIFLNLFESNQKDYEHLYII